MSRTRRKPYTKSKRFDKTCRCHGSCSYCRRNRLASTMRRKQAADYQMIEERLP